MRRWVGVAIGTAIALGAAYGIERLDQHWFDWPGDFFPIPGSLGAAVAAAPLTAKAMAVGGLFIGALAGGLAAVRIGRGTLPGWIVAGLVALTGAGDLALLQPHQWQLLAAAAIAPLLAGPFVAGAA